MRAKGRGELLLEGVEGCKGDGGRQREDKEGKKKRRK